MKLIFKCGSQFLHRLYFWFKVYFGIKRASVKKLKNLRIKTITGINELINANLIRVTYSEFLKKG